MEEVKFTVRFQPDEYAVIKKASKRRGDIARIVRAGALAQAKAETEEREAQERKEAAQI